MCRDATRGVQPAPGSSFQAQTFPPVQSGDPQLNRHCPSFCTPAYPQIDVAPVSNLPVSITCLFRHVAITTDGNRVHLLRVAARG
jgi:hypothetical protein